MWPGPPSPSGLQAAGGGQQPWRVLEPEVTGIVGLHFCGSPLRGCRPRSVACLSFCCASVRGFVPWTLALCLPVAVFLHLLSDFARGNICVSHLRKSGSPALGSCVFLRVAWCTWPRFLSETLPACAGAALGPGACPDGGECAFPSPECPGGGGDIGAWA